MDVIESGELQPRTSSSDQIEEKDPRKIARKYQLELCRRAVEENTIVYLETGCGKTHIAVLLIYELGHLIRKPQRNVCVFLAPTVHLVRQQAMVVEYSTNFKVGIYVGNSKRLNSHLGWEKEIEQYEVLVMTPQILLRNLEHCLIRMERIALLIFDECHHAQTQNRHPYAQIMREFYSTCSTGRPRIFGMTASPIVGKGGSNQADYSRCINSLETLLDSKVYTVEDKEELDSFVASPKMRIYFYGPITNNISGFYTCLCSRLEELKNECLLVAREMIDDPGTRHKKLKLLRRVHENVIFCLESLGHWGGGKASQILSSDYHFRMSECEEEDSSKDSFLAYMYLKKAISIFNSDFMKDMMESGSSVPDVLEEPFFSKKLLLLIRILSTARLQENMKCIIFVKRIIIAQSLAFILGNLKSLDFWRCHSLVGFHSGLKNMSRKTMNEIVEKFRSGKVNLLVATNVAEEGLDIQTCCLVIRFDLPESVTSFIQSRGRARMQQSEYAFLVERENQHELAQVTEFISNEDKMNKEIASRTSAETFGGLVERRYKVDKTGANISTGSSVSILHHFCSKLPHDEYYSPKPLFFYTDDLNGTVCHIVLPPNAPLSHVDSSPHPSKDEAKRDACLKACKELHAAGCLTDYLLPEQDDVVSEEIDESDESEADEDSREELHERLIPTALSVPWTSNGTLVCLNFYFIKLKPIPEDRVYSSFGLFVKSVLPKEAESMCLDLHLSHGRIVKTEFVPLGTIEFDNTEITDAQNFQEMWLKIILDRKELFSDFIALGRNSSVLSGQSTFYLLLPVTKVAEGKMAVDWTIVKQCLSSPIFRLPANDDGTSNCVFHEKQNLKFLNGIVNMSDVPDSLVVTPHNGLVFCVVDILSEINGHSLLKKSESTTYINHFKKFNIELLHPEQPLLKAKQLFNLRNLLQNRLQCNTEAAELEEHFVELPPEVCSLKVLHFSKEIGSTLSLLPSVMHRLENLLVAIELKDLLSASFSEGSKVSANRILEALTTEKCSERFSLERLEVLGDAFLKYAVGRRLFLSYESQDEGQLTKKRSNIVNNLHLRQLAIENNLQVYIRDQWFDPRLFHAFGRPCAQICSKETQKILNASKGNKPVNNVNHRNVLCTRNHHWLHRKTIADVIESLVGAYIVDSGFKAAESFLRWIGIQVDFQVSDVSRIYIASESNLSVMDLIDVERLEKLLGYKFLRKGILIQAFMHPSHNQHSGGCYQRLEFLGDAVLDYLITSYLYSAFPDLKPGELTDLRSMAVNNNSFAHLAVSLSFHSFLISDSSSLSKAIKKFSDFVQLSDKDKDSVEEPSCPKVLGDLVESCVGAILLDAGFDLKCVWKVVLAFLDPIKKFSRLKLSPIRELRELCQSKNFGLCFPSLKKDKCTFSVKAIVEMDGSKITGHALNVSKKAAERMASQDVLLRLKAQGYRYKAKSLEEIVQSTHREEAVLIGYDETPIKVYLADLTKLRQLQVLKVEAASSLSGGDCSTTSEAEAVSNGLITSSQMLGRSNSQSCDISNSRLYRDCPQTEVAPLNYSAKCHLYEMCSANCWNPPFFECLKEEGPPHLKSFTFKVVVKVEQVETTVLECFSEPRLNKKAAMEHAAEGALWIGIGSYYWTIPNKKIYKDDKADEGSFVDRLIFDSRVLKSSEAANFRSIAFISMSGDPADAADRISEGKEQTFSEIGDPSLSNGDCSSVREGVDRKPSSLPESKGGVHIDTIDCSQLGTLLPFQDGPRKSAKSRLYELCTAYCWKPPSFQCYKEEGEGLLKVFTFKVTVEAEEPPIFVECYSLAKSKKKAAEEHAAEGALWYLRHIGY
ncbi:hypothetical protein H6P81_000753 [Aristolochia fimbriata]|uniref:Dicer-like protein 4 n=1 Tax=Aristolochia fimbriata TaxID=158543 RepID=A0AAV7F500_ARIFI|nr:hypothetical protein H6P81_000753 [Aristolochia fimbriata]